MANRCMLKVIVTIFLMISLISVSVGDSAVSIPNMDTDLGDSDASFWGEGANDFSGNFITGAGDVNGDGYDDILIGVVCNDEGGTFTGQTYLIFGKKNGWSMDTNLSDASASFWGEDDNDKSGRSVAGVGDVNGDGFDDILIGASGNDDEDPNAGQAYLIFGTPSSWSMDGDLSNSFASFLGEEAGDHAGGSVAGVGDVNGDGYNDILIGANGYDDGGPISGRIYLILGKASGWSMDTSLSRSDASFRGEKANAYFGNSFAGAGDVNGDGYDDILISLRWDDEGGHGAGQTYLVLGKASGWSMDTNISNADASFIGENSLDLSGSSIAGAGDVNGDGFDDILIGSFHNNDKGSFAGQTYLILGRESGWLMDTFLSNADASFLGEDAEDLSGSSVAGAGDINMDGYDDILIGAENNDEGGYRKGQTYLVLGKASGWSMDTDLSNVDASFWGEDEADHCGASVAGAGDVNGDGYADILIGAPGNNEGGSSAGQTYLILSTPETDPPVINSLVLGTIVLIIAMVVIVSVLYVRRRRE